MKTTRRLMVALVSALLVIGGLTIAASQAAHASTCVINNSSTSPPEVKLANSTSATATSASFSPPPGVDIVVQVALQYDHNTSTGPAVTVKDSQNTAYTAGPSAYDGSASGTYTFSHYYASAPGSVTVKATRSGATGAAMYDVKTRVLTGAASSQAGAASTSAHATSGTSLTHAITPTALGSDVEAVVSTASNQAFTASGLTTDSSWNDANDASATAGGHVKTQALTAETVGWTVPSSTFWSLAALEVLPGNCGQSSPVVTTNAASGVTSSGATLNGSVNPEGAATTYQFDYGTTTSYGSVIPAGGASAGSGSTSVNESATPTGLSASTAYHYRIEATNSGGTTFGADQQFTTQAAAQLAAAFTFSPSNPVTGQQVTFDGSGSTCDVSPCTYKYIDTADGSTLGTTQVSQFTFQGAGTKFVQLTVTDANSATAQVEHDVVVTAAGTAPVVSTNAASGIGSTTATLNGSVNPEGASTSYQFDYGTTAGYGTSVPVPAGNAGSGTTAVNESANVTGLTASTGYHYRIEATNSTGTTFGNDQQFTTSAAGGGGTLTYSPPACGGADGLTCTTINLSASGSQNPSLASNVDYKLIMPSTPISGGTLTISGGHNVQIIGGQINLNNPCDDSCSAEGDGAVYITDGNPGEVYIEGVWIHNTQTAQDTGTSCPGGGDSCSTADGIDLNVGNGGNPSNPPSVVLQNIRIDGISGCSGGADHADGYQPYNGGTSTSFIDHMTITSNCQAEELDPDYGFAHFGTKPNYVLKNVNVDTLQNPYKGNVNEYGYYLTGVGSGCPSGNVSLSNVYEQEPSGSINVNSVWPDTNSSCASSYNGTTMSFPNSPQITGVLTNGQPSGGDYVPVGVAGIGYVSPGYQ